MPRPPDHATLERLKQIGETVEHAKEARARARARYASSGPAPQSAPMIGQKALRGWA